jgi:cytochrome c-type biogenesis protein CcmH/NrfG
MSEWWLVSGLVSMGSLGLAGLFYPLQLKKRTSWLWSVGLVLLVITAYLRWGTFFAWHEFAQLQQRQQQVKALLATTEGRAKLINELSARLKQDPHNDQLKLLLTKIKKLTQNLHSDI